MAQLMSIAPAGIVPPLTRNRQRPQQSDKHHYLMAGPCRKEIGIRLLKRLWFAQMLSRFLKMNDAPRA